jgi:hypothetical protein
MGFIVLCCITSQKSTHMGATQFEDLQRRVLMESVALSSVSFDGTPEFLCDWPKLRTACAALTVEVGNKELDLVVWQWIQGILGLLNLYLDEEVELGWRKASLVVSKAQDMGKLMHDASASGLHSSCRARRSRSALARHGG